MTFHVSKSQHDDRTDSRCWPFERESPRHELSHVLGFLRVCSTRESHTWNNALVARVSTAHNSTTFLIYRRSGLDIRRNLELTHKDIDAFKNVDKVTKAFSHIIRRLENKGLSITSQMVRGKSDTFGEEDVNSRKYEICGGNCLPCTIGWTESVRRE